MNLNPIDWYKKVKVLLKLNSEVKKMKLSELKTSEGRIAILGSIVAIYSALQGIIPAVLAAQITGWLGAAYIGVRGLVKFGEALAPLTKSTLDDKMVEELKKLLNVVPAKPIV